MKVTLKLQQIVNANALLKEISYNSLDLADAKALLKFRKDVRAQLDEFEEFRKDAVDRLKPEGYDENNAEQKAEFEQKVIAVLQEEWVKDVELEITPISTDAEAKIMVNSHLTGRGLDEIDFIIAKEEKGDA